MGYLVGVNSAKTPLANGGDSSSMAGSAAGQRQQPEPPRETAGRSDANSIPGADAPSASGTETKPALDGGGVPAPAHFDTAPVLSKPASPVVSTVVSGGRAAPPVEAGAWYLQVAALQQRQDAENVIRTLREQNLPAMAQNPRDGLFHVLVGPYHQMSQVAEAKARLKTLGFANAFVQR
jgi:cell division septation protein DedD